MYYHFLSFCVQKTAKEPTPALSDQTAIHTETEINIDEQAETKEETSLPSPTESSEPTNPLSIENITKNSDGTYSFTDDFLTAIKEIYGDTSLTEKSFNEALQESAKDIKI